MAWSTRELAELAGTTVNTIRHYHRLGLLDEPERRYNGYKQYGVRDLVRLLRIRRLADLGVPLSRISEIGAGAQNTPEALRELDAELAANIERLQHARAEIAAILREEAPADAPAGFASVASQLSESDSSILHIYGQLYDEEAMADLRRMVEVDTTATAVGKEIDALPADADEAARQRLAERLAPVLAQNLIDYPWLTDPVGRLSKSERLTRQTFIEAVVELYNPAQVPEIVQPIIVALAGTIPFIEGEGAALIGVVAGIHPVVAAAAAGNFVCVLLVVLLTSRARTAVVNRSVVAVPATVGGGAPESAGDEPAVAFDEAASAKPESKGRRRFKRWLVRFGVPGASILGPLAIPTQFTSAMLVASGTSRSWVLLWQAVAIVLWTTVATVSGWLALQVVTTI